MKEKDDIFPEIKPFNDHPGCKGHANWMLDCTFEKREERDILLKAIDGTRRSMQIDIKREALIKK